ncbi:MAG TPA: L,D-transpeptidase family protein, partial [Hyphomicrobium sp.]|nr:L,D-transpeptidase family protein [Hyphomicrobium sp.]
SFGDRVTLFTLCATVAFVSAMTVLAIDHHGLIDLAGDDSLSDTSASTDTTLASLTSAHPKEDLLDVISPPAPQPARRLAYVTKREIPLLFPPLAEEYEHAQVDASDEEPEQEAAHVDPVQPSAQENPQWWSAEIRRDQPVPTAGPRVAVKVETRLPWQSSARGPQIRDKRLIERLAQISPAATDRLTEKFRAAAAPYPPSDIALVAIKDEKMLELHARASGRKWKLIHRYPVTAASGASGPKLRQGDKQVPEGVYGVSFLNPDSKYHVSLRVNYPNAFDREMAAKDGRLNLGGDIMIHGKNVSVGCLAVGDEAAEELFVLASKIGLPNVKVIIAPTDFRRDGLPEAKPGEPGWLPSLYTEVASAMSEFERPPPSMSLLSFFGK